VRYYGFEARLATWLATLCGQVRDSSGGRWNGNCNRFNAARIDDWELGT
jgi:hypothetical protein